MKNIAIIGTNGLPAKYGGFETLVEYLVKYLAKDYDLTIFCSSKTNKIQLKEINGCKLEYINLKANGWQSVLYDFISIYKSRNFDKVIILGASGGLFMPLLFKYKNKFILNFGGLDWKRSKWSYFTRSFLKLSEALSIRFSKYIISDNLGIQKYIKSEYGRKSILIEYGGDQSFKVIPEKGDFNEYFFLKNDFAFTVSRIQSDNNIQLLLDSFDNKVPMPLVFVGNWNNSNYGKKIRKKYSGKSNLILLDAIYDNRTLNLLRSNCNIYVHGHSAGGTNPALVEAMNLSLPIFAFDCDYNRYTTEEKCKYFLNSEELLYSLKNISKEECNDIGSSMFDIAKKRYKWKMIVEKYSKVLDSRYII